MPFAYYKGLSPGRKRVYRQSDAVEKVALPDAAALRPLVAALAAALDAENRRAVEAACQRLADAMLRQLALPPVRMVVLAARPSRDWGELHGYYDPTREGVPPTITLWMRTAQRKQVVAFRTFLRTFLHEIGHHLDYELLNLSETFHTEGFYKRESSLFRQLMDPQQAALEPGERAGVAGRHGFTRVDEEERPAAWVECLDTLHREPFYRAYKQRVREILAARPDGLYLEVGAGAGTDALALGARVLAVDRSLTMSRESRARGVAWSVVADAEQLPVSSSLVDGCWADRTFQHLADPRRALGELIRGMKPGATLVVVDPDYGTQSLELPDQGVATKVMAFRADHLLRNGRLAHRMADLFREAALEDVAVEERVLVVRDPTSVDNVMGLRSWAMTALARGMLSVAEVLRWETQFDAVVAKGTFRWSVSFFVTSGRKPPDESAARRGASTSR